MDIFSTELFSILTVYFVIGLVYCCASALIAGYIGVTMEKSDYYDCILWPFSALVVVGGLARICVERVKKRAEHKERKTSKQNP